MAENYSVSAIYDSAMPSAAAPTRQLYTFQGYFTAVNGGGEQYYNADMSSAKDWDYYRRYGALCILDGEQPACDYYAESTHGHTGGGLLLHGLPSAAATEAIPGTQAALPDGLNMDRDTGKISGKPNETGDFSVKVTVYDGEKQKSDEDLYADGKSAF